MTAYIHPTALVNPGFVPSPFTIVDEGVAIFEDVTVGSFVHIHAGAKLRKGCAVGDHVTIWDGADLGERVVVQDFAVIGKQPPAETPDAQALAPLVVGADSWIGNHTVVYAGIVLGEGCEISDGAIVGEDVPADGIVRP